MSEDREEASGPLDIFGQQSAVWEEMVSRFEEAWQQGNKPHIEDYLIDQEDPQRLLLKELVRVELECRLKAGEAARVEEYLQQFPTLAEDDPLVLGLIRDERRLRGRREQGLSDEEYLDRFPQYGIQLTPERETRRSADYHLLFGLLALQNDFVLREELVAAASVWLLDKSRSLSQILLQQGALAQDERDLLSALVEKHLEKHGDVVEESLAALSSIGSLREAFQSLGDSEIDQTLCCVPVSGADGSCYKRGAASVGASTSAGERFRVLRPHARGGLGQVSVAVDDELNREVALKEILPLHAGQTDSRTRFVREAEITGGLEHPGIVPVYSLGQYRDGRPFYVMRFIKGDSLEGAIKRFHTADRTGHDPRERLLELRKLLGRFIDVCQAIEYAHSRGVLHRDLKPGNIMLGKYGETLVVDWGLAKPLGHRETEDLADERTLKPRSGSAPTQMGSALGTPAFMPPEQAAGKLDDLGPASDVYSLGATLYYLLTGQPAFEGRDVVMVLADVQKGVFPKPHDVSPATPRALEAICLKAMATDMADRYTSPQLLADDVERYLADESVLARTEPVTVRIGRWIRKHPKSVTALIATVLVGLSSAAINAVVVSQKNQQVSQKNQQLEVTNAKLDTSNLQLAGANQDLKKSLDAEAKARARAVKRSTTTSTRLWTTVCWNRPGFSRYGEVC